MDNQILPELEKLESLQIFTKEDWLEKLYRKSESEGTKIQELIDIILPYS